MIINTDHKKKIYLACPYSHPDAAVRAERVAMANEAAGSMMESGLIVFSPLSHSHPIAETMPKIDNCDHGFWLEQDLTFLVLWADEMWVMCVNGWENSKGIKTEIDAAKIIGMPVRYFRFDRETKRMCPVEYHCLSAERETAHHPV
jgi:hypothetical protein